MCVILVLLFLALEARSSNSTDFQEQYRAAFGGARVNDVLKRVVAGAALLCVLLLVAAVTVSDGNVNGISAFLGHPLGAAAYLAAMTYLGIATLLHPIWYFSYKKARHSGC